MHWFRLLSVDWRSGWKCSGCSVPLKSKMAPSIVVSVVDSVIFFGAFNAAIFLGPWYWALLMPVALVPNMFVPVQLDERVHSGVW